MGWRKVVHRLTGKCMARYTVWSRAEVRLEVGTDCDGKPCAATLFKFGEMVDVVEGDHGEVVGKVYDWLENDRP